MTSRNLLTGYGRSASPAALVAAISALLIMGAVLAVRLHSDLARLAARVETSRHRTPRGDDR